MSQATIDTSRWPSVNTLTAPLVQYILDNADVLRVDVEKHASGATIIDAGIKAEGGLEAGRLIAEICMGGLGHVNLQTSATFPHWPWMLSVHSNNPILSCLGSQYAGWSLAHEKFFSLGSGPGRALAGREELYKELGYQDKSDSACLVLESDKAPPAEVIEKVARDTGLKAENLTFILTPTRSLAGTVQIVARVLEVAMHKIHTLHFPLENVVDGMASAPLPPPAPDFLIGMGRTNDAILFGGHAHIFVKGSDADAAKLAQELPSSSSRDYGRPFAEVFKAVNMDFYKIDPLLFSPAAVTVTALESGKSFTGGKLDAALLDQSFGYSA
ncbi:methenyltetrahydromethanopterin cyclohydrolase [Methylobacillus caricis]|uniref:methenyltetrahydromethanopterin cyclohydrolase n=1 Tax=Methylobacillus caricis TaxID=1971611 RepID=UPI001CFFF381|nr:methenyltetrahydromethanopterin cyclohydrolase [Methylobacillus caricis]MCB5187277.1 methenyltetrahydromethanopterin cyclohydrolase [Methylobacillus caricis]